MNSRHFSVALAIVLFLGVEAAKASLSQAEAVRTLKGIGPLPVIVEELDAEVRAAGLTTEELNTECELRLRKAGIPVPANGSAVDKDAPYLYVYVNVFPVNSGSQFVYNANIQLRQRVSLARSKSTSTLAMTWDTGTTGIILSTNLSKLRSSVGDLMDEFANAYLSANPKK